MDRQPGTDRQRARARAEHPEGRRALARRAALLCALAAASAAWLACAVPDDALADAFDDFVEEHNACDAAEDCVVIYTECPLGCFHAVAAEHEEAARARADELVEVSRSDGSVCAYDCLAADAPTCEAGRCQVEAADELGEEGDPAGEGA